MDLHRAPWFPKETVSNCHRSPLILEVPENGQGVEANNDIGVCGTSNAMLRGVVSYWTDFYWLLPQPQR